MIFLACLVAAALLPITALHAYWGLGGVWPGTDAASCARAVVGFRGVHKMPTSSASFLVATCLALATLWPLSLVEVLDTPIPTAWLVAGAILMALVFLGRGIVGFTPAWRRLAPEQPFAANDLRYFSPLCVLIGVGFLFLAIMEFPG